MKNKIKAIIFDVGGVLALGTNSIIKDKRVLVSGGVHKYVAKKIKISIDQYFDSIDSTYAKAIEGKLTKKQILNIFSKNLKFSPKKLHKIYIKAYKKNFKQNKQLFKHLFKLKQEGYKVAVLSDQWYISKEALMPTKLYSLFDEVVVSCDVGLRKPNNKIYKLILKRLKLKPSQTIFIDNQKWNIYPARKLGIKTILFKDNKQLFKNKLWENLFK